MVAAGNRARFSFAPLARAPLAAWIVAVLASAEIGVRIAGVESAPPPEAAWWSWDPARDPIVLAGDGMHQSSLRQLWSPMPGAPVEGCPGERVNPGGYRGPELLPGKSSGVLRVALLGGTEICGAGVCWSETSAAVLVDRLAERGVHAEVLDAGVLGFTIEQGIERYCALVRSHHPDVVVAAFSGVAESAAAAPVADRLKIARHTRERHGWARIPMQPSLDLRSVQLLARIVERSGHAPDAAFDEGVERRERRLAARPEESGTADWAGQRRVPVASYENALARLIDAVRSDGARPILVQMPREPRAEEAAPVLGIYSAALESTGASLGVAIVDARTRFREAADGEDASGLFRGRDVLSARGHALLAECLASTIAP